MGKFKKGPDGKHSFDIDMRVDNPEGKEVLKTAKMLAEAGHILLEDDIAKTPYGKFYTTIEMPAGVYRMTLDIYDNISGGRVSVTESFTLR